MQTAMLKRYKGAPTNEHSDADRTVTWVMTTGTTDRDGETVDPTGGDFSEYQLNPTVQWNHDTDDEPIGNLVGLPWNDYVGEGTKYPEVLGPKRMALLGRVKFDTDERSDRIYQKVRGGSIKGGSISFVPQGRTEKNGDGGSHYPKWKLLEFTICSVGSNPDAIATNKKSLRIVTMKRKGLQEDIDNLDRKITAIIGEIKRMEAVGWTGSSKDDRVRELNRLTSTRNLLEDKLEAGQKTKRSHMKRKCWIHKNGKSAWLLMKDGGIDKETAEYLEQRGLEEVQIEADPPDGEEWETEEAEEMSITGARPPEGKAEEVADEIAVRAMELADKGVDEDEAIEAAMDEEGVAKGMRGAVKQLARRSKATGGWVVAGPAGYLGSSGAVKDIGMAKQYRTEDEALDAALKAGGRWDAMKFSDAYGRSLKVYRHKATGQLLLAVRKGVILKVNGDEVEVDEKQLKLKGPWPKIGSGDDLSDPSSSKWGLPTKLTNWYGEMAARSKSCPALKDVDLTGEEQKEVEEAVDQAFMKAAEELEIKTSDSLVPQEDLKKLLPKSLFKRWCKDIAEEEAEKHKTRLQPTIISRAQKFIRKVVKADDVLSEECSKLLKSDDELSDAEKGLLAAHAASLKSKWQKKFGSCGKKRCSSHFFCAKCVKKLVSKMPEDEENKATGGWVVAGPAGYLGSSGAVKDIGMAKQYRTEDEALDAALKAGGRWDAMKFSDAYGRSLSKATGGWVVAGPAGYLGSSGAVKDIGMAKQYRTEDEALDAALKAGGRWDAMKFSDAYGRSLSKSDDVEKATGGWVVAGPAGYLGSSGAVKDIGMAKQYRTEDEALDAALKAGGRWDAMKFSDAYGRSLSKNDDAAEIERAQKLLQKAEEEAPTEKDDVSEEEWEKVNEELDKTLAAQDAFAAKFYRETGIKV